MERLCEPVASKVPREGCVVGPMKLDEDGPILPTQELAGNERGARVGAGVAAVKLREDRSVRRNQLFDGRREGLVEPPDAFPPFARALGLLGGSDRRGRYRHACR